MNNLKGKVAWITGAGTGIGLAGAQALAEAGAIVVMSGRRKEVLAPEAEKIKQRYGCCLSSMVGKDETIEVPSVGGRPAP